MSGGRVQGGEVFGGHPDDHTDHTSASQPLLGSVVFKGWVKLSQDII